MNQADIFSFMQKHRFGVVSSVSSAGLPQSALVGIATTPDLEIIFDTVKSSRKYANLTQRPSCSFAVGWESEQTLQYEGIATEPAGLKLLRYQEQYFEVWPESRAHLNWQDVAYFVVKPRWLRYSDYDQKPPLIVEIEQGPF